MHTELPPAHKVRQWLGLPPLEPKPEPISKPICKPRGLSAFGPAKRTKAARKAVELTRSGMKPGLALIEVGLPRHYTIAVAECLANGGQITDAILRGSLKELPNTVGNGQSCFIRWFYNWPKMRGQNDDDNLALRKALLATGKSNKAIARGVEMHATTIGKFISGKQPRMLKENRMTCWEWLKKTGLK